MNYIKTFWDVSFSIHITSNTVDVPCTSAFLSAEYSFILNKHFPRDFEYQADFFLPENILNTCSLCS